MEPKELQKEFIGRGEVRNFHFTQILKTDAGYIYEVKTPDLCSHYEVFQRKVNSQYNTITYPQSPSFSIYAWTFYSYADALQKFNML